MGQKETKFFNREAGGPSSGNINRVSYYEDTKVLEIKFRNGRIYQYEDVPEKLWQGAVNAPSIGKFMNQEIKGVYSFKKI